MSTHRPFGRRALALSAAIAAATGTLAANTVYVYQGPGGTTDTPATGVFNNAGNWGGGAIPLLADPFTELDFSNSNANTFTSTDDFAAALSLNALQFNLNATTGGTGMGTIATSAGDSFNFVSNGAATPSITQNGLNPFTVNVPITITNALTMGIGGSVTNSTAGAVTLAGAVTNTGGFSVTGGAYTISGLVSGAGTAASIGVSGGATLSLTNSSNSFQGDISVNGAGSTLSIANIGAFGATPSSANGGRNRTITLGNGGQFIIPGGWDLNVSNGFYPIISIGSGGGIINQLSGTLVLNDPSEFVGASGANLTKTGAGQVQLNNSYTFTGSITVNQGILELSNAAGAGTASGVIISPAASGITGTAGAELLIDNNITFARPVTVSGTGIGSGGALVSASGQVAAVSGTVTLAGNSSVNALGNLTLSGGISDGGGGFALTKIGGSTLTLSGPGAYSGGVILSAGTVVAAHNTALGSGPVAVASGTSLTVNGSLTAFSTGSITNSGGAISFGAGTKATVGTITNDSGSFAFGSGGALSAGAVTLGAGTLSIGSTSTLSSSGPILINGGTFSTGAGATVTTSGTVTLNSGILNAGASTVLNTGTITLNGGTLTSGVGTVVITDGVAAGVGAHTITPGGTYVAGTNALNSTIGTLNIGSLSLTSLSTVNFDLNTPTNSDMIGVTSLNGFSVSGTVPLTFGQTPSSTGTYHLFSFNSNGPLPSPSNFSTPASVNRQTYALSIDPATGSQYYVDLIVSGTTGGTSYTFIGTPASPADWNTSSNWAPPGVPGVAGDIVTINNGVNSAYTINANGQQHVGSFTFANSGTGSYNLAAGTGTGAGLYMDSGTTSPATLTNSTNNNAISAPVALSSNTSVVVSNASNTLTISGLVSGAGTLTIDATNAGTVSLTSSTSNTYSGGTVVNGGTLVVAGGSGGGKTNLGVGDVAINAGGTLVASSGDALGYIGGATSPNNFNIAGGTLTQGSGAYRITLRNVNFTGGSLVAPANNSGDANGNYSLYSGVVTSSPASTTAQISGGKVSLETATTFTIAAGNVTSGSTPGVDLLISSKLTPYGTGTNGFTKAGAGVMELSNPANSYTGTTTVTGGTLIFAGAGALPAASTVQPQGGVIQLLNDGGGSNQTITQGNSFNFTTNSTSTIFVGNNGSGNTGNTVALGTFNVPNNNVNTINFTGANGYLVKINSLGLPGSTGQTTYLVPTSTSVTIGAVSNNGTGNTGNYDTLVLDGTSAGNVITGVIADASNAVAGSARYTPVTKQNSSTWTLLGANTYTGNTSINGGTLALGNGGSIGNSAVSVANGATLAVIPGTTGATNTLGKTLNLNAGSNFTMADGATSTLNVASTATLGGASVSSMIFDIGGSTTMADLLHIGGAATVGAGGESITVNAIGATPLTPGDYTLVSATSGLGTSAFSLYNNRVSIGSNAYTLSLANSTSTSEILSIASISNAGAYFTGNGGLSSLNATNGPATNWATDSTGTTDLGTQPTSAQDVYFTASTVPSTTPLTIASLGQAYTVNSLNYTSGTPAITINNGGSANALTINGGGITVAAGAGAQVINVPVVLGAAQTFLNNSSNVLTLSNGLTAGTKMLTLDGAGGIAISGTSAFSTSVGLTVNSGAGAVNISAPVTLGAPSTFTNNSSNALALSGGLTTGANLLTFAGSGGATISGSAGFTTSGGVNLASSSGPVTISAPTSLGAAQTFTNNSANALTFGTLTAGANALTVTGSGNTTLSGNLTSTSTVTKTGAGTLTLGGANNSMATLILNSNSVVDIGSGVLNLNNSGASTIQSSTGGTINGTGGGTLNISTNSGINFGDNGTASGTTLTINAIVSGNNGFEVYNSGTSTGMIVLTAMNTFKGDVNVDGGVLSVAKIGNAGSTTSNLGQGTNIYLNGNASGTLVYTGTGESTNRVINLNGSTGGGVIDQSGTGLLKFTANFATPGSGAKVLVLQGSTDGTGEIAGAIINNSSTNTTGLTKQGTGMWTLSGANTFTGPTNVNGGILNITGKLGSTAVSVNANATLAGNGTLGGSVTIAGLGTLAPSVVAASPTTMTITGALKVNNAATLAVNLYSPTSYDQVLYGNAASLGGATLTVNDSAFLATNPTGTGQSFYIVDALAGNTNAISGTFAQTQITDTTGQITYAITYNASGDPTNTGNDVMLTVVSNSVPEPTSLGLLAVGVIGLLARRRRPAGGMKVRR